MLSFDMQGETVLEQLHDNWERGQGKNLQTYDWRAQRDSRMACPFVSILTEAGRPSLVRNRKHEPKSKYHQQ